MNSSDDPAVMTALVTGAKAFALKQLMSTAYLAASPLDEGICERLRNDGLTIQDLEGFWSLTAQGRCEAARLLTEHLTKLPPR